MEWGLSVKLDTLSVESDLSSHEPIFTQSLKRAGDCVGVKWEEGGTYILFCPQ